MGREAKLKELQRLEKMKELRDLEMRRALRSEKYGPEKPKERRQNNKERSAISFGEALDTGFSTGFGSTIAGLQQINSQIADLIRSDKRAGPTKPTMNDYLANLLSKDKETLAQESIGREDKYQAAKEKSKVGALLGNLLGSGVSTAPISIIPGANVAANPYLRTALTATRGAAEGAAGAAAQYVPEGESRLTNALMGGSIGGAGSGILGGIGEAAQSYSNSKVLSNEAKKILQEKANAAKGTETPLGKIIDDPVKNVLYEKILMNMPMAGATQAAQRTQQEITKRADDIVSDITGGKYKEGVNPNIEIQSGLRNLDRILETAKTNNYKEVDTLAEKLGVNIKSENFQKAASEQLTKLTKSKRLAKLLPDKLKEDLQEYSSEEVSDSLQDTNLFRAQLGEIMRDAAFKNDREGKLVKGTYNRLLNALDEDIGLAIDKSGSKELLSKYKDAQKFYKEEIVPMQDKLVSKYLNPNTDADTLINNFFKPMSRGQERGILLNKITSLLDKSEDSEDLMNNLRLGVFSKAFSSDGKIDVNSIQKILGKIGPEQRRLLFSGKNKSLNDLNNLSTLNEMNKSAKAAMGSMFTGHGLLQYLGLAAPLAGYYVGEEYAGLPGGVVGAVLGSGMGVGKYATKRLTSPQLRDKALDKMLAKELQPSTKNKKSVAAGRIAGTLSAQEEEKKPRKIEVNRYARVEEEK